MKEISPILFREKSNLILNFGWKEIGLSQSIKPENKPLKSHFIKTFGNESIYMKLSGPQEMLSLCLVGQNRTAITLKGY